MSDNPFRYGHIAVGEHFTDRAREIHELVSDVRSGQSVVIISPRRFGKTSLVMRARDQLVKHGTLVAYADLFRATTKQRLVDEVATALYRGVASPLERARARALDLFQMLPVQPRLTLGKDGSPSLELSPLARAEDLDRTLQQLLELPERLAAERGRRAVVVLDEFQEIVALDAALPAVLRSIVQAQQHVAYVYLGSRQHLMSRVFTDRNEPLYRSARPLPLGPITPTEFTRFIRSRFESTNVWIEDGAIAHILGLTGGHPHDTQELCHFTWALGAATGSVVTAAHVDQALARVVEAEDAHYTTLWESLGRSQRPLVQAIAREPGSGLYSEGFRQRHRLGSAATVQKALKTLLDREVIEGSTTHGYHVPDVFFRAWMRAMLERA
jgi:uncharacterized protein